MKRTQSDALEVARPTSIRAAWAGLGFGVATTVARFVPQLVQSQSALLTGIIIAAIVMSAALFALGIQAMRRAWRLAPVVITAIAIWDASEVLSWGDSLSFASAVVGIGTIIAIWLPSSRRFLAEERLWLGRVEAPSHAA